MQDKDGAQHVDGIQSRVFSWRDILQERILVDPGVVDDNVDLELARFRMGEMVLGHGDQMRRAVRVTHIRLHRNGFDAVGGLQGGSKIGGDAC